MKTIVKPDLKDWEALSSRPSANNSKVESSVKEIISFVKDKRDKALLELNEKYDSSSVSEVALELPELEYLETRVGDELVGAIETAIANVSSFHSAQEYKALNVETMPGVQCWREARAIERVGLYVPGGTAPLFSTLIMLAVPAALAGCKEIVICTPPPVSDTIQYVAKCLGFSTIYQVGGAQAVAAMAYGTESVPKVDKIFGPGNQYVTAAKQLLSSEGLAIDMPAGPSEVLVIADNQANPQFVASDLLSQAEHGPDSQVVLCCLSEEFSEAVQEELSKQLESLPRADTVRASLANSLCLVFESLAECISFSNSYAPEHLIIQTASPRELLPEVSSAGSVFVGAYSPESCGDYASGTNHTLPTAGFASAWSGVSLDSFQKKITFQEISPEGLSVLGPSVQLMAEAEGLDAHKQAVSVRLSSIQGDSDE